MRDGAWRRTSDLSDCKVHAHSSHGQKMQCLLTYSRAPPTECSVSRRDLFVFWRMSCPGYSRALEGLQGDKVKVGAE